MNYFQQIVLGRTPTKKKYQSTPVVVLIVKEDEVTGKTHIVNYMLVCSGRLLRDNLIEWLEEGRPIRIENLEAVEWTKGGGGLEVKTLM